VHDPRYGHQKVVYHINGNGGADGILYRDALRNMKNHIDAVGVEALDLRAVLHGAGVGMLALALQDLSIQTDVKRLQAQGVTFLVCAKTLAGQGIEPSADLFEVCPRNIVSSGVAELTHLQQLGYSYMKP
jgi:intracellular sulfur oxidation DsrE/DsrF family protein